MFLWQMQSSPRANFLSKLAYIYIQPSSISPHSLIVDRLHFWDLHALLFHFAQYVYAYTVALDIKTALSASTRSQSEGGCFKNGIIFILKIFKNGVTDDQSENRGKPQKTRGV